MLLKLNLKVCCFFLITSSTLAQHEHPIPRETNPDSTLIVIFPFFKKEFDDAFAVTFSQARFKIADTAQISHNLLNHELFNNTARKVIELASRKSKNIYSNFSKNEIDDFKVNTLYSDIILIHLEITSTTIEKLRGKKIKKLGGYILAYNLRSGEFIHCCSTESKITFYDEAEGMAYAIRRFAAEAFACFSGRLR
jgi:hypothetical protein